MLKNSKYFDERRVMRIQVTTVHRFLFLEVIVCLVAIVTNSEGGYLPLSGRCTNVWIEHQLFHKSFWLNC